MHPALSVIFFTVSSGTGYGLLFLLGLCGASGVVSLSPLFGLVGVGLALTLISFGLLSSTWHLGHPERSIGALSQWRTSWLSREGVVAIVTYIPTFALAYVWYMLDRQSVWFVPLALISTVLAAATVYCTAMIYRSLPTIHQWSNHWTVLGYLSMGLAGGAVLLSALASSFAIEGTLPPYGALATLVLGGFIKNRYWHFIDTTNHPSTPETATGLGHLGKVRLLDSPHTEDNYLLSEMGYQIARKHATKLRRYAQGFGFAFPFVLIFAGTIWGGTSSTILMLLAALSFLLGAGVERWLFFAEAKHTVTLYYGTESV